MRVKGDKQNERITEKTLLAAIGLICFGAGVYLTIQANIGVAPWDALNLGLSKLLGFYTGPHLSVCQSF